MKIQRLIPSKQEQVAKAYIGSMIRASRQVTKLRDKANIAMVREIKRLNR